MNTSIAQRLRVLITLPALALGFFGVARGELLFERHQGGPTQYNGVGDVNAAFFHIDEAIQVQAISGWMTPYRTSETDTVDISSLGEPETAFETWLPPGSPHPTDYSLPVPSGEWVTVGSLHWNLPPGSYRITFEGMVMPYSYGYYGPISDAASFDEFANYFARGENKVGSDPIGVRIYGVLLSSVPEPEFYGAVAAIGLAGAVLVRRKIRIVPGAQTGLDSKPKSV